jgi:hypothetical protein
VQLAATALALSIAALTVPAHAAVHAQVDRSSVPAGDTVTLTIDTDQPALDMRPDVRPLDKDFEVVGTSTNRETRFVNGTRSDHTQWAVRLQPRHAGVLDIPAISVGDEQTVPLKLTVAQAAEPAPGTGSAHVFVQVEAPNPDKPIYVQQQIPYTVRLFYDDAVVRGELAPPDPGDAIVEQLGAETRSTAVRNGHTYNVVERRYAIAPEKSGVLHIPPARFSGTAIEVQGAAQAGDGQDDDDPMQRWLRGTPFANDPFFRRGFGSGMGLGDGGRPVSASSQAISINVQPRPATATGDWLPAQQVTLHDSWQDNPPHFEVGEPVTRTITVNAKGLAASQVPALTLAPPGNARMYPEASDNQSRTDGEFVYGISKQSVTYIPTAAGTVTVPAVNLGWWNTQTNSPSVASLPAVQFDAVAAAGAARATTLPASSAGAPVPAPAGVAAPGSAASQPAPSMAALLAAHWRAVTFGSALLALLAALAVALLRRRRHRAHAIEDRGSPAVPSRVPQRQAALLALQRACSANDAGGAKRALLDLARSQWPDNAPRGLRALADRLDSGGAEIRELDRVLYGTAAQAWKGSALWDVLQRGLQATNAGTRSEGDGLQALYASTQN